MSKIFKLNIKGKEFEYSLGFATWEAWAEYTGKPIKEALEAAVDMLKNFEDKPDIKQLAMLILLSVQTTSKFLRKPCDLIIEDLLFELDTNPNLINDFSNGHRAP